VPINTATIVAEITSGVIFSEDIRDADYQTKLKALREYVGVLVRVVALKTIDLWLRCQRFLSLRTLMNWFGWEEVVGAIGTV
jgi:hypothetical protein